MKKILWLLSVMLLFASCGNTQNTQNPDTVSTATGTEVSSGAVASSSLEDLVKKLAPHLGKTEADVTKGTSSYEEYRDLENMTAFSVKNPNMTADEAFAVDAYAMFDGWVAGFTVDPLMGYYSEYISDEFICSLKAEVNDTDKVNQYLNAESEEEGFALHDAIPFVVTLDCSENPKEAKSLRDINFIVSGGESDDWNIFINKESLALERQGDDGLPYILEFSDWKYENDTYSLKEENDEGSLSIEIKKAPCMNAAGENEPWSAMVRINDDTYTGCAEKFSGRFYNTMIGKLSTLLKETGIAYTGKISPEVGEYVLGIKGDLIEATIHGTGEDDSSETIVFRMEDAETLRMENGKPQILWMGGYVVSPEVCEANRLVRGLHTFGVFWTCPRG